MGMIPQMIPWFDQRETRAVADYMSSGGFLTEFTKTRDFEDAIADFTGAQHAVVVSNGTVSLWMMLMALEINPGDEILVPNYTMIATANVIRAAGAKPVFCDVELETLCIDFDEVKEKTTPRTKALFLVNANGRYPSYDIQDLIQFCAMNDVHLLEDSAQGLGSFYPSGHHVGTLGEMGSFSFSVPKIITTGQGGAVVTNNAIFAEKLRKLKDFGRIRGGIDLHDSFGLNFKFTDIQAVIGLVQMEKLNERVLLKKKIWKTYRHNLSDVKQVEFFNHSLEYTSPWFIDVLVEDRENLISYLTKSGITTRVMYPPINKQKAFGLPGSFPVSDAIGARGLWLPSFSQLTLTQIDFICDAIIDYYSRHG
jgi:perosamine synthetase